jgi:hypothetical protein
MAIDNDRMDVAAMIAEHLKIPFDAAAAAGTDQQQTAKQQLWRMILRALVTISSISVSKQEENDDFFRHSAKGSRGLTDVARCTSLLMGFFFVLLLSFKAAKE